jgi:hypothetical protein
MDLPPKETLRSIVRSYAEIRASLGSAISSPRLIQPTSEYFPDEFHHDVDSLNRLLDRLVGYAPWSQAPRLEIALLDTEGDSCASSGSCGCGSGDGGGERSGLVEAHPDGYLVWIQTRDASRSETLVAVLARAVGSIVFQNASSDPDLRTSEMAAVACGFGVLLMNGASVWGKSCGGLRMTRVTAHSVEELGVALGLFGSVHQVPASELRRHLDTTQRAAFDVAHEWTESNPMLVLALRERPRVLLEGEFDIEPSRGPIGRWLYKRKLERELRAVPAPHPDRSMTEARRRRLLDARALVDEVMDASEP